MKQKKEDNKPRLFASLIIISTILLCCYFLTVNFPKLEHAASFHKRLNQIPSAVNLRLSKGNINLFRKSFAWNRHEMYISNDFHFPDPEKQAEPFFFHVNGQPVPRFMVFRFKNFCAVRLDRHAFVFTRTAYGIKDIAELEKYIMSLYKLLLIKTIGKEPERILSVHEGSVIRIKHAPLQKSPPHVSFTLPIKFKKNRIYEVACEYMEEGYAIPKIAMNVQTKAKQVTYCNYLLYRLAKKGFRRVSILFSPDQNIESLNFVLSNIKKKGVVFCKSISVHQYAEDLSFSAQLTVPKIIYHDFYSEIKKPLSIKNTTIIGTGK